MPTASDLSDAIVQARRDVIRAAVKYTPGDGNGAAFDAALARLERLVRLKERLRTLAVAQSIAHSNELHREEQDALSEIAEAVK